MFAPHFKAEQCSDHPLRLEFDKPKANLFYKKLLLHAVI